MAEYKGGEGDGMRIRMLQKQRENELKELNKAKEKLKEESKTYGNLSQKFESVIDQSNAFKNVGLVSVSDFKKNAESNLTSSSTATSTTTTNKQANDKKRQLEQAKKKAITKNKLSFDIEDQDEEQESTNIKETEKKVKVNHNNNNNNQEDTKDSNNSNNNGDDNQLNASAAVNNDTSSPVSNNNGNSNNNNVQPKKVSKFGKDPTVNTDFLPDKEREELLRLEKERLTKQWNEQQEKIKAEKIEITYSYWDGSGHRRVLQCTKGTTIDKFLEQARLEFKELRGVTVDHLLFVKEDLIIPHAYSFYDLIIEKARGKSGPLFKFDVHEDIRLVSDATVEKDETHAAKMVEKTWYERNKHIFPASRWEIYDPAVQRDKYTISDKLKQ